MVLGALALALVVDPAGAQAAEAGGGVDVGPGDSVVFRPGGLHVMLMKRRAPLEEGARFPLTLRFEKAGEIEVEVVVGKPGAMAPKP